MDIKEKIESELSKLSSGMNSVLVFEKNNINDELERALLETEIRLEGLSRAISKTMELLNDWAK